MVDTTRGNLCHGISISRDAGEEDGIINHLYHKAYHYYLQLSSSTTLRILRKHKIFHSRHHRPLLLQIQTASMLFIPSMKDFTRTAAAAKSLLLLGVFLGRLVTIVHSQCFQDESMNAQWAQLINGDDTSTTFSIDGTCCQETVCNVPCAAEVPPPPKVCVK